MISRVRLVAPLLVFMALSTAAEAVPAPRLSVDSINALDVPSHPYDNAGDADRAVDAALARARASHKLVLIDLGGDWCAECRILSGVMALPEMNAFLAAHYETVLVDVGRMNRNLQIPARYGITDRLEGAPVILVVAPDGTLVNRGHVFALDEARSMTPQAMADWLAQWIR